MLKLITVDDEYLVRLGLSQTIDWQSFGFQLVAEAVNGMDALEKIHALHPDVIISDVKMPVMDGVQLVAALYEENYDGIVLMLSGFNEFDYAKSTLEKGVYRYLLKPLDNNELVQAVVEAGNKLIADRQNRAFLQSARSDLPTICEKLTCDLLHGDVPLDELADKFASYGIALPLNGGVTVFCRLNPVGEMSEQAVRSQLVRIADEMERMFAPARVLRYFLGNHFGLIVEDVNLDKIENRLVQYVNGYSGDTLSVGVSGVFEDLDGIPKAYGVAKYVANNKLYVALSTVATHREADKPVYKQHVVQALRYVSENYSDVNLSVRDVAEHLGVSESYLMHLFKDNLNKTFNTCLTELRMFIAKRMLLSGKWRVNEIAEQVGYYDVKYFSQVFKKIEGVTPSEYVKREHEKNNSF